MTGTANSTKEQQLSLYLQICADAYGENLAENNKLDSSWQKVCRLGFNPTEIIEIAEKRVA